MSVTDELQNIVSDITVAIVERKEFGRVELERLRQRLSTVRTDVSAAMIDGSTKRSALDQLCTDIERGTADLRGLARRVRAQLPAELPK